MHAELVNLKIGTSSAEFKILQCYWLKNSSCVDRSTRKIRRSTHKKPDCGVSKSKIRVSHPPTQQIFAVCATRRVPLRRPCFPPFFGETIFVWTARRVVAKKQPYQRVPVFTIDVFCIHYRETSTLSNWIWVLPIVHMILECYLTDAILIGTYI